jgi:hypothetical protein
LSNLKVAQTIDNQGADNQSCEKRGKAGERGAKSKIAENAKGRKVVEQLKIQ